MEYVVEMLNITKDFPGIRANDDITLRLRKGEVHALLGENGAGKSTLMSILFGLYQCDGGSIRIRGEEVKIDNPNVANALGIGMVHQHFKLVHNFTVTENIILGIEPHKGPSLNLKDAANRIRALSKQYGLNVDPDKKLKIFLLECNRGWKYLKCYIEMQKFSYLTNPLLFSLPKKLKIS